jgi:hypothetical protein
MAIPKVDVGRTLCAEAEYLSDAVASSVSYYFFYRKFLSVKIYSSALSFIVIHTYVITQHVFFVIPFYLQSVLVHSANCVKTCIHVYSDM